MHGLILEKFIANNYLSVPCINITYSLNPAYVEKIHVFQRVMTDCVGLWLMEILLKKGAKLYLHNVLLHSIKATDT